MGRNVNKVKGGHISCAGTLQIEVQQDKTRMGGETMGKDKITPPGAQEIGK
jgi:hypothetical protein